MRPDSEKALLAKLKDFQSHYEIIALQLAEEYALSRRQEEASNLVRRLIVLTDDPERKAFYLLTLGRLSEQLGESEVAASYYAEGLATEPQNKNNWYFLHNNLAHCLNERKVFQRAEWLSREAIVIDPHRHHARHTLGVALEGQGKWKDAAEAYVDAVTVAPTEPQPLLRLEHLLRIHPEVVRELPGLHARLEECHRVLEKMKSTFAPQTPAADRLPHPEGNSPLVVILDDDESIVEVLGEEIRRRGGRCLGFKHKEEFLGQITTLKPDLVLTDIMSPGLDGLTLLRKLRSDRAHRDIPVIVVSGSQDDSVEVEARRLGAYAWLPKPFAVDRLFETITEALRKRYRTPSGAS